MRGKNAAIKGLAERLTKTRLFGGLTREEVADVVRRIGESDVTLPFATSEDCARYLGVTRTALSLAISRLVKRGEIVHPGHSRFVICGIV